MRDHAQALGEPIIRRWRCPKRLKWRARQDSNLRPSAPEADALSTELQARELGMITAERGKTFGFWFALKFGPLARMIDGHDGPESALDMDRRQR
jgi:hypothetical protein